MVLAPEAVQSDRDLERKHPESVVTRESAGPDAAPVLAGFLSAFGSNGSNGSNSHLASPVMRHPANGEMRVLAMRRTQQGLGNHKTQQLVAQLRRSSLVQRQCSCGNTCTSCQSKSVEEVDESRVVQRQAVTANTGASGTDENVIPSDSPGQPLDPGTRESMESRFGSDFSDVRVHTDDRTAQSANALSADAYTTGRDIYFAAGKYAPGSQEGEHLIAHELVHTVQQSESNFALSQTGGVRLSLPGEPLEREADLIASQITSKKASVSSGYPIAVQRRGDDQSTASMHKYLEDRFAQEYGQPPEGGAHGAEYANWLAQRNYDDAVALLRSRDPTMYSYLRQGRVGQTVRVRTVSVPVQGGGANSPSRFEFRFDLEAISGGVQGGALAQFLTGQPDIQMTVPTATATLRMPMNFNSPDGPNAALRLAEYLYHEGIHMLLAMDRLIEGLIPGSTRLQSGKRAAVEAYRAQVQGNRAYLVLAADLEVVIGAFMTQHHQSQAQSDYRQAAQRVINGVIDERFAVDQQRQQFPGNPVSNSTIAQAYIPNELSNELIVLSNTGDLARLIQEMTAVLNLIPAGGSTPAASPSSSSAPQSAPTQPNPLQRQTTNASGGNGVVDVKVIPADSPGQPLDHGTRSVMESRFGTDFSEVRVHTDTRAAQSAAALAANAYTTGRDIYFAAGKYAPASKEGQHLLAHELTHTVQQPESNLVLREAGALRLSQPNEPMEQEAEAIAGQISRKNASVISQYRPAVARQADAGVPVGSGLEERATRATSKEVIRALEKPDPIAGVGDYREAFRVLNGLAMFALLATLDELKTLGEFDLLQANFGTGEGADKARLRVAMHAVRDRGRVTADGFAAAEGDALATLPADQQADVRAYLDSQPSGVAPVPAQQAATASGTQGTAPVNCTTPYKRATNFQELIDLVRAAEGRLAASGITSVKDQIHALRGIYYGTIWSKDFSEEKSATRNEGFQRFTRPSEDPAKTVPPDVQKALDCGLFNALQNSQDMVDPSGRHVDFGHLIIALDARFDPKLSANVSYPVMGINIDMGGSGPELVTWVGDLGGGTARLARARVKAPSTSASISFTGSDYGGSINLEGDIAGYVVASGGATTLSAPNIAAGKRLSDALQDYLSPGTLGSAWKDRAKTFLAMNGGVFDPSGALTNRTTLIAGFSAKFQVFACNYLASRVKDNHLTSATAKAAANHVIPASEEIAEAFINALEDSVKTGGKIEARRFPAAKSAKPGACTQQIRAASLGSLLTPGASVDEEEKEPTPVQRQATPGAGAVAADPDVISSDSPGHPLDHGTRRFMESRFGADFSDVRVHTDGRAAQSAAALAADAYTTGRDIYFAAGKYAPGSQEGQRLLAHELTHTAQQPESPRELRSALQISSPDDPLEQEADRVSQGVVSGEITAQISSGESVLARDKALTSGLEGPAAVIQRNSDAGVPPDAGSATDSSPHASPVGSTRFVTVGPSDESVTLFDDESTDRSVLEGYITVHGLKGARHRIFELQFTLSTIDADLADWSGVSPQRDALLERRGIVSSVLDAAKGAMAAIEKESEKFLNDFEQQSKIVLLAMLDISESKVMAEAEHYGIESSAMLEEVGASLDEIYSMAAKPKEGLTKAAKELAAKLRALSKKIMEEIKYLSYVGGSEDWAGEWMVSDVEGHKRWQQELDDADYDYMSARAKAVAAFPILASYATPKNRGTHYLDESADELEEINESSTGELALKLQNEIYDRLSDIQDTRHNLEEGDLKIWKLPSIVSGTKTAMDIQPGTLHDKLVDEHVEDVISDEGLIKMALAALALALGIIAAIPTGGGSLVLAGVAVTAAVGSATISAYVAYSDLKEYSIQSAANGTDFEKAQAISQDEPSLFWLAISVVGAVVDIGAAVSAFGKLAKAAREVQEARRLAALGKLTEEEAASSAATLDRLKKDADAIHPGLGAKIEARVGKVAGEEAGNVERLASKWEEGLNQDTRAFLEGNAEAKALYREMDPAIRDLLSHCASICIIPNLTRRQYAQIKAIVYEHGAEEVGGLKQFFHFRRNELDAAITELREAENLAEIKALLEHTLTSSPIQAEEEAVSTWQRLQEAGVQTDSQADFIDKYRSGLRYDEGAATWYNPVKGLKDTIPLNASAADALAKFKATEGFESFRQLLLDEKMITGDEDLVKAIEGMKTYRGRPVDAIRHAVKDLYRDELIARMAHPNEAVMRLRYPHLPWDKASEDALRQASYQEMRRMTDALPSADKGNMFERWYQQVMSPGATEHVRIDLTDLKGLGSQEETARVIDKVQGDTIHELKRVTGALSEHDLSQFGDNMLLIQNKFAVNGQKLEKAVYTFPIPEGVRANAKWMAERLAASKGTLTFEVFNSAGEVKILKSAAEINKPAFWTWLGVAKP